MKKTNIYMAHNTRYTASASDQISSLRSPTSYARRILLEMLRPRNFKRMGKKTLILKGGMSG